MIGCRATVNRVGLVTVAALAGGCGLAGSPTVVTDAAPAAIECDASTGVSDGCADWGRDVLARGAPSRTFELEDVVRIRLVRAPFADDCTVEYYLGRYPDEVAWSEEIACRDG